MQCELSISFSSSSQCNVNYLYHLKGQYHGKSMGDIMIFGQNSLNLNFEHCVN